MRPDGHMIFNGDDDKLAGYVPENGATPIYFGLQTDHPFHAVQIDNLGMRGTMATFVTPDSSFQAHISIPGDHMVYNALAGTAVGYALGMNDAEIKAGIEALVPLAGRGRLIETDKFTIIDDCYNANPASMKSSLDVLAKAEGRKTAILGDMFELGENEKEMHHEIGAYAAAAGIDVLVCIGQLAKCMAEGAKTCANIHVRHFDTKTDFFAAIDQILEPKDTILVKASHGMAFSEIVDILENSLSNDRCGTMHRKSDNLQSIPAVSHTR